MIVSCRSALPATAVLGARLIEFDNPGFGSPVPSLGEIVDEPHPKKVRKRRENPATASLLIRPPHITVEFQSSNLIPNRRRIQSSLHHIALSYFSLIRIEDLRTSIREPRTPGPESERTERE
jgi:hypothetical protein